MRAAKIEDFQMYRKALEVADAVSALLKRSCFQNDVRLREQLSASSAAVPALMAEGFGLGTDQLFAQSLYRSRAESKETRTHLAIARGRDYLTAAECDALCGRYEEVERMTTGLIRHLQRENRRVRG
jgi:four helix bundle protein